MNQSEYGQATPEQMEGINRYTRRTLNPDEVFVFSVILCDNQIDRDGERFPRASLEALGELFLGKTGIFDHSPTAKNQSARIFETALEEGEGVAEEEPACRLRAWAYMLQSEKNRELIQEIDGGIKKEVSVGCAVRRVVCSICGADRKTEDCPHQKGQEYSGRLCHHRLEEPTDAYEWSFVAVPAQKAAGVTKRVAYGEDYPAREEITDLQKLFDSTSHQGITLTSTELSRLEEQYRRLVEQAHGGELHRKALQGDIIRLFALTQPEVSPVMAEEIAARLNWGQLEEMRGCLTKAADKVFPPSPQLAANTNVQTDGKSPFMI